MSRTPKITVLCACLMLGVASGALVSCGPEQGSTTGTAGFAYGLTEMGAEAFIARAEGRSSTVICGSLLSPFFLSVAATPRCELLFNAFPPSGISPAIGLSMSHGRQAKKALPKLRACSSPLLCAFPVFYHSSISPSLHPHSPIPIR